MTATGCYIIEEDPQEIKEQRAGLIAENINLKMKVTLYEVFIDAIDGVEDMSEYIPDMVFSLLRVCKMIRDKK